jgi:hypothetical protein
MTSTTAYTPLLGEDCASTAVVPTPHCEYHLDDFGPLTTAEEVVTTFNTAATYVGGKEGGVICWPPGELDFTAFPDTAVGTDEGAGLMMTAGMSNITIRGSRTTIKLASNMLEAFVIDGAENTVIEGFIFDNSANGVLQNQVKVDDKIPGGGVVGLGNAANCAIRQYSGANLTVQDCEFIQIHTCCNYFGDHTDNQVRSGTVTFQRNRSDGCCFGLLASQPEHIVCSENGWFNGIDSVLSTAARDPGHLLYINDTFGLHPYTVTAIGNYGRNHSSSVLKMRKGIRQVATGNVFHDVHRGIESHRSQTCDISGNTIGLGVHSVDANNSGIEVTGCEQSGVVASNNIDRSGTGAYGIRLRPAVYAGPGTDDPNGDDQDDEPGDSASPLNNVRVSGNQIVDDLSGDAPREGFISVLGMTGGVVKDNDAIITGNVALVGSVFKFSDCHFTRASHNSRQSAAASTPSGSDRLYTVDAFCTAMRLGWERGDIDVAPTTFTITDDAADTTVVRTDGIETVAWSPTLSFVTPGNFSAVNFSSAGSWIEKRGEMVVAHCELSFDTNAYTTAAGLLKISFPYAADTFGVSFHDAVGFHQGITLATDDVGVLIGNTATFFTLRRNAAGGVGAGLDITNFPASTAGFKLGFAIPLRITET